MDSQELSRVSFEMHGSQKKCKQDSTRGRTNFFWQCLQFSSFESRLSSGSTATSSPFPLLKVSPPPNMLLLSDEMEIVDEVVIDEVSELDVGKVGEVGDRFVEELLLDEIIRESSGSIVISFVNFIILFVSR